MSNEKDCFVDERIYQKDIKQMNKDINGLGDKVTNSLKNIENTHNQDIEKIWKKIETMQENFEQTNKTIVEINKDIKALLQGNSNANENRKIMLTAIISLFGGVVMAWIISVLQIGN